MTEVNLPDWYIDVQTTDPEYTKKIGGGEKLTSIDATYQMMKATNIFGLYGKGWGLENLRWAITPDENNKPLILSLEAVFFYPDPSPSINTEEDIMGNKKSFCAFEISSDILLWTRKGDLVKDARKKLQTDVITKALSRIGFSADVFLGKFDDDKYVKFLDRGQDIMKRKLSQVMGKQLIKLLQDSPTKDSVKYVTENVANLETKGKEDLYNEIMKEIKNVEKKLNQGK